MSDDFLLTLEFHHALALSEANRTEGDDREAALAIADGLVSALSTVRAEGLPGLGAKARALLRQAPGGRLAVLIEHGGIEERLLASSTLMDVARLVPAQRRGRAMALSVARAPLARLAGANTQPLDASGKSVQDSEMRG